MQHLGEIISLLVAVFWTVTALFADKASHRIGSMSTNVLRLAMDTAEGLVAACGLDAEGMARRAGELCRGN